MRHSRQLLEFRALLLLFILQLLVVSLELLQLQLEFLIQAAEGKEVLGRTRRCQRGTKGRLTPSTLSSSYTRVLVGWTHLPWGIRGRLRLLLPWQNKGP